MVIGGSLSGNAAYRMLPVSCPRQKVKGVLTGVSPCQNALACGSPDWTRTSNPLINSQMLCQLSYRGLL